MSVRTWAAAGLLVVSVPATAADIDAISAFSLSGNPQADFRALSEDLGAALSYKAMSPAEPLGITGFDVALEVTNTVLENPAAFNIATSSSESIENLPLPKLHAHKGLPGGVDIGALYSEVENISLVGAELKYAILKGNTALPAVAIRGTYSKLSGVDQLDFETVGGELSVSKGFAMLTPYAGIGQVRVTSTPKQDAALVGLREEKFTQDKIFLGLNINLGLVNIGLEGDKTGDATSYGAKLGLRF